MDAANEDWESPRGRSSWWVRLLWILLPTVAPPEAQPRAIQLWRRWVRPIMLVLMIILGLGMLYSLKRDREAVEGETWLTELLYVASVFGGLCVFALLAGYVRNAATSGGWFFRFLEKIRQAVAYETPSNPQS